EDGRGKQGIRPPLVGQPDKFQDLGRDRSPQANALSLSQPAQPPDPLNSGRADASQDRGANLHPGTDDQDDRTPLAGRAHGKDPRLGGRRTRRVHALLSPIPLPTREGEGSLDLGPNPRTPNAGIREARRQEIAGDRASQSAAGTYRDRGCGYVPP